MAFLIQPGRKSYGNRQECVGTASTFVRVAAASSAEGRVVHTLRRGEAPEQTANVVTNAYNERRSAVSPTGLAPNHE